MKFYSRVNFIPFGISREKSNGKMSPKCCYFFFFGFKGVRGRVEGGPDVVPLRNESGMWDSVGISSHTRNLKVHMARRNWFSGSPWTWVSGSPIQSYHHENWRKKSSNFPFSFLHFGFPLTHQNFRPELTWWVLKQTNWVWMKNSSNLQHLRGSIKGW